MKKNKRKTIIDIAALCVFIMASIVFLTAGAMTPGEFMLMLLLYLIYVEIDFFDITAEATIEFKSFEKKVLEELIEELETHSGADTREERGE